MSKTCTTCNQNKPLEEFSRRTSSKDGHGYVCRQCEKVRNQKYYQNKKDTIKQKVAEYAKKNRETVLAKKREHSKKRNKKALQSYRVEHREQRKQYISQNRDKIRANRREYYRKRREDPLEQMKKRLRGRIYMALKKGGKRKSTEKLLGATLDEVITYLGMAEKGYELDHICPFAQAKNTEEVEKLCHYTNLRWLPKEVNQAKKHFRTPEAVEMCRRLLSREWIDV